MIIAIDFDGTITKCPSSYPECDELSPNCTEVIKWLYDEGHILKLNTCRARGQLKKAIEFMKEKDILKYFSFINENCPKEIEYFGGDCRKISADVYIDDKNLGGFDGWLTVKAYLTLERPKRCLKSI